MLENIYRLSRVIFEDEFYSGIKFNEAVHDGDYTRAKVITDAMKIINPDSEDILKLDDIITNLCEENK